MTRRASSHHAAMFFDDLSRQFLPTLAQFANALFLRRELFALFRDNFRLGPGDEVLVAQLSLQPGNLLLRLGNLAVEPLQFFVDIDHASQWQIDLDGTG